jgi:hypothetical protein
MVVAPCRTPEAASLPPWNGLYIYPLNQPGRRSRFRAEPESTRADGLDGGLHPLNPYAPTSPTHLCYNETRHSAELLFRKMGCSGLISMERSMEGADV